MPSMPYINHVALPVAAADEAAAFYRDWFGAKIVASPKFPIPVVWLLIGRVQLHLVEHPGVEPCAAHHFAVSITGRDEFELLYRRAEREGLLDRETMSHHIFRFPTGNVQMWMKDPSGNVVEVDYPDHADLDPGIAAEAWQWADDNEMSDWNKAATLFMPEQAGLAADPFPAAVGTLPIK